MKDLLLAILFISVGLILPVRYLLYRLRMRETNGSRAEVEWRPPNHHEVGGTVGGLLAGFALLALALSPDRAASIDIQGATGPCSVADGKSFSSGVERRKLFVTPYADHSAFVDALSDSLGSVPDSIANGARWPSVRLLADDRPVQIEADFKTIDYVQRSVGLSVSSPDATDALTPGLSARIAEIAQGILSDSPDVFGCTGVERYPAP